MSILCTYLWNILSFVHCSMFLRMIEQLMCALNAKDVIIEQIEEEKKETLKKITEEMQVGGYMAQVGGYTTPVESKISQRDAQVFPISFQLLMSFFKAIIYWFICNIDTFMPCGFLARAMCLWYCESGRKTMRFHDVMVVFASNLLWLVGNCSFYR